MKRYGAIINVNPERFEEYKKVHSKVWPGVLKTITECKIRNFTIFHKDGVLFSYYEYIGHDFKKDMEKMADDPITQKWWDLCNPMQTPLKTRKKGEWWAFMKEVFHHD